MNGYSVLSANRDVVGNFEVFSEAVKFWEDFTARDGHDARPKFINDQKQMIVKTNQNEVIGYIVNKSDNKITIVNVIEVQHFNQITVSKVASFADTPAGNLEAKETFVKFVKSRLLWITPEEVEEAILKNHCYCGKFSIFIARSTEN